MPCAKASMPPSVTNDPCGVGALGLASWRMFFLHAPNSRVEASAGNNAHLRRLSEVRFLLYNCLFIYFLDLSDRLESDIQVKLVGAKVWRPIKVDTCKGTYPLSRKVVTAFVICPDILRIETAVFGKREQIASGCRNCQPFDGLRACNETREVITDRQIAEAYIRTVLDEGRDGQAYVVDRVVIVDE